MLIMLIKQLATKKIKLLILRTNTQNKNEKVYLINNLKNREIIICLFEQINMSLT